MSSTTSHFCDFQHASTPIDVEACSTPLQGAITLGLGRRREASSGAHYELGGVRFQAHFDPGFHDVDDYDRCELPEVRITHLDGVEVGGMFGLVGAEYEDSIDLSGGLIRTKCGSWPFDAHPDWYVDQEQKEYDRLGAGLSDRLFSRYVGLHLARAGLRIRWDWRSGELQITEESSKRSVVICEANANELRKLPSKDAATAIATAWALVYGSAHQ